MEARQIWDLDGVGSNPAIPFLVPSPNWPGHRPVTPEVRVRVSLESFMPQSLNWRSNSLENCQPERVWGFKSLLRRSCTIRITASIPVLQTGGEGSIPSWCSICPWPNRRRRLATNQKIAGPSPAGQAVTVAQQAEQRIVDPPVAGSRPVSHLFCRYGVIGISAPC